MPSILIYNALLLAIEAFALVSAKRQPGTAFVVALSHPVVALILSVALGGGIFGTMGLLAYGLFIHTPLVFAASAFVLWHRSRALSFVLALLTVINVAIGVDAFLVEPHALEVTKVDLTSRKLTRPVRIVLLADMQMKEVGAYERNALQIAIDQKPDLVAFAGDYLHVPRDDHRRLRKELADYLTSIRFKAPLGVYAVPGNVDPPGWIDIFAPIGATTFPTTTSVESGEFVITGLSLRDSFDRTLRIERHERFHIVLGHAPDFALGKVDADLLLAGHTHGGQVVLPWIGPLMTLSAVPRDWASGLTELSRGRTLIVSRGVGMERGEAPPLRFLCHPEIIVIDITPDTHE